MIRIAIADDHHLFREGLVRILNDVDGLRVVASASSGEELLTALTKAAPDLVFRRSPKTWILRRGSCRSCEAM